MPKIRIKSRRKIIKHNTMQTTKLHEFKVVLEGIELSTAAKERIQIGLQSTLLQEIARLTPQPDGPDDGSFPGFPPRSTIFLPHDWIGIWLRVLDRYETAQIQQVLAKEGQEFA
jgi:hypothetical protein